MQETKAHIKERMLRAASAAWGYQEKIEEASFDPLLALLLDVYASELEKTSQEIGASRERVLQQMMQLMAPETLTGPEPAHAIVHAASSDGVTLMTKKEQFCTIPGATESEEVWFAPAGDFLVNQAILRYQLAGLRCYQYPAPRQREFCTELTEPAAPSTLWLGIDCGEAVLPETGFYFNLNHEGQREKFLYYLPEAQWFAHDSRLNTCSGFSAQRSMNDDVGAWMGREDALGRRLLTRIQKKYSKNFVQLEETVHPNEEYSLPAELSALLPDPVRQQCLREKLIWIKIVFPEVISAGLLEDLYCQPNCFPVLNRRLHHLIHRLQDYINIIPLSCSHQFLNVHNVDDEAGNSWLNGVDPSLSAKSRVLLRRTGANRFDERDARNLISQLLQLLREESVAFGLYGRDFIQQEILSLQQSINRLQQKMRQSSAQGQALSFLQIEAEEKHTLFIDYWSTQGLLANGLRPGTPLLAYRNGSLRQSSIVLVTGTSDGRNELLAAETIPVFQSALLSRDRIASEADIRLFCIQQVGKLVQQVLVKKGVRIGTGPQSGYQKTIDVYISIVKKDWLDLEETGQLPHLTDRLERSLEERSLAMVPFRVFLNAA